MVGITLLFAFTTLLSAAVADGEAYKKDKGLVKVTPRPTLRTRDLSKRCEGTCAECFGTGYISCPGSNIYCYLPGDSFYGLDSCSSTGSDSTSAPASTSTGSAGNSDYCSGVSATCVSCFGPGYLSCPDGEHCYNPDDPMYDSCETSSGGVTYSSCAETYGTGSIDCGTDSCYNPGEGDVCCGSDGYHCEDGDTCSTNLGYCCSPGSTSSGCSGGGSGLSSDYSSYTYSYTYSSYSPSTTRLFSDASSTADSGDSGDASSTGVAQFGDSSSADRSREVKIAGVVLGMFGLGMFLL